MTLKSYVMQYCDCLSFGSDGELCIIRTEKVTSVSDGFSLGVTELGHQQARSIIERFEIALLVPCPDCGVSEFTSCLSGHHKTYKVCHQRVTDAVSFITRYNEVAKRFAKI